MRNKGRVLDNQLLKYHTQVKNRESLNFGFLFSQQCKKRTFPVYTLGASFTLSTDSSTGDWEFAATSCLLHAFPMTAKKCLSQYRTWRMRNSGTRPWQGHYFNIEREKRHLTYNIKALNVIVTWMFVIFIRPFKGIITLGSIYIFQVMNGRGIG